MKSPDFHTVHVYVHMLPAAPSANAPQLGGTKDTGRGADDASV